MHRNISLPEQLTPLINTAELNIIDLQCIRDDRILFEQLNFTAKSGELIQIEGHNGSGKTSLLRILCGLTLATEGQVLWNNTDILDDRANYWTHLNYIGHTTGVKSELTPLENLTVARALSAHPTDISLDEALARVGLYGFEDVPSRTLSAGQKRRVALARLLINDAPLWILDEPFTALDKHAIKMLETLFDAHAQRGGLALLTSHHTIKCDYARILKLTD